MSDQPKPTGEWTAENLSRVTNTMVVSSVSELHQAICDAHNIALDEAVDGAEQEILLLRQQLSAEWEKVENLHKILGQKRTTIKELREQLEGRHKLCVDYEMKWKAEREKSRVLGNLTYGLRIQLAAEREKVQTLADASQSHQA